MPKRKNKENLSSDNSSEIEYEVEKIKDKRIKNGKIEYLIKWLNYSDKDSTWEPIENMENSKLLIEEYEKQNLQSKKKEIYQNNNLNKKKSILFSIEKVKSNDNNLILDKQFEKKNQNMNQNVLIDCFLKKKRKTNDLQKKKFLSIIHSQKVSNYFDLFSSTKNKKNLNLKNKIYNKNKLEISVENSFSYIQNKIENEKINNFKKLYKIKKIISCCKYNNNIIICVSANKKENLKNELLNLLSKDIAEIDPKLLINYYESHIQFSMDK